MSELADFSGRVAVVTGGSTGMGRATVERLARGGASVVFCSNDAASVEAASRELRGQGDVEAKVADVSRAGEMESLMRGAAERFGGIDLLACCAGIQRYGTVEDTDESVWDEVLAVNLKGCYLASRYAIPEMRKRGGGAIVHVSSVQGLACQTQAAAYATSKGGLNALTRSMALDFAKDRIRVNAVCPAVIETDMAHRGFDQMWERLAGMHPIGRIGKAGEVADAVVWLCSDHASFVTGHALPVDGGRLAQ
jgi:NAD(P)-dependent dehydrogenase (short-subunit alcohol dehydrogenase family)